MEKSDCIFDDSNGLPVLDDHAGHGGGGLSGGGI